MRRGDGREKILKYHFGKSYKLANQFPKAHLYRVNTGIHIDRLIPIDKLQPGVQNALQLMGIDSAVTTDIKVNKKTGKSIDMGFLHYNPNKLQQDLHLIKK